MKPEFKVGLLFIGAVLAIAVFALYLGVLNPLADNYNLRIAYNFAGGIEVGSPVRVMGIKVGKVKKIIFDPENKMPNGEEVKLLVDISVNKSAWPTVREDSKFFINLAGVIGEKFIEISPGSIDKPTLKPGQVLRGEDPPRIDQLISQSYGLAGKIFKFVESNEGSVIDTIKMMNNLVTNLNALLRQVDSTATDKDVRKILKNFSVISTDLAFFTQELRSKDGEKTLKLIKELIWRLEDMDKAALKKFLQEEGIKARMF